MNEWCTPGDCPRITFDDHRSGIVLILARHGRTPANAAGQLLGRRDPSLDDVGRRQAELIGESISAAIAKDGSGWGSDPIIVSSPLVRCMETARLICDQISGRPEVMIDERFIEIDYGDLEGMPVGEVPVDIWKRWQAEPDWAPGGGESLGDVSRRVAEALDDLGGRNVVVVTHVSPIKAAVGWVVGCGPEIAWKCHVAQASIHRIDNSGRIPRLVSFNETCHL